ncbi:MAG: glycosyltransferase family 9 protein, partial [Candidatus Hydrogenedentes bacterium]|nr:glycosyltransferase family 9 protein [Candidatus Hydrogenedentota bacterium]
GLGVVRLDRIGDFVLATPALRFLYDHVDEPVTLIGHELWKELALWLNEHHIAGGPLFDSFVGIRPETFTSPRAFADAARQLTPYARLLQMASSRTNGVDKLIATAPGEKTAPAGDTANTLSMQRRLNNRLYDQVLDAPHADIEYERNIEIVAAFLATEPPHAHPPLWSIPKELREAALRDVAEKTQQPIAPGFIALNPYTSVPLKNWPQERFVSLINTITQNHPDMTIVLLGAPEDRSRSESLTASLARGKEVVNAVGKTSLVELGALLPQASLLISGDTAAPHLASAVGCNTVVILGGRQHGRFFPYPAPHGGRSNQFVSHGLPCNPCVRRCRLVKTTSDAAPCIAQVTADAVYDAAREVLSTPRLER